MISLVSIKTTNALGGFRVHLLADSTEDVRPVKVSDISGIGSAGPGDIMPGSICYTPDLKVSIMKNTGEWGEWV